MLRIFMDIPTPSWSLPHSQQSSIHTPHIHSTNWEAKNAAMQLLEKQLTRPQPAVQIHQVQGFPDDATQWGETQGRQEHAQLIGI